MSNLTRIVLIEDDVDYERLVTAVLEESSNAAEVKTAPTLAQGLIFLKQYQPEVILVDLNLPDSAGYQTFLRLKEQANGVPIIVLTGLDDDETAIQAVKDGAQDYLVKSLTQPKLIARSMHMALHRLNRQVAHASGESSKPGMVLGFMGSKGGVGTSSTAVNVAAVLVQNGWNTIVIEPQAPPGTLSIYAPDERARGIHSLLEKPPGAITPLDLEHHLVEAVRGLRLLCPTALPGVQPPIGAEYAHAIISTARQLAPCVVLDLPAHIDGGVVAALKLCDCLALIVDREPAAVRCGATMLQQIEEVISPALTVRRVVVERTVLDEPLQMAEVQDLLKVQPTVVVPQAASAIARSHRVKTPLLFLHPDEAFRLAHLDLAQSLLALCAVSPGLLVGDEKRSDWKGPRSPVPETLYG